MGLWKKNMSKYFLVLPFVCYVTIDLWLTRHDYPKYKTEIKTICRSIKEHGTGGKSKFSKILQDADRMDLWGAIFLARVFSEWPNLPYYTNAESFTFRPLSKQTITKICRNKIKVKSIVDRVNIVLNIYQQVNTISAKNLAKDKIQFLNDFLKQLKKETIDL